MLSKQIKVVIKSDYYKAWEKYIEERTEASVTTNDAAKEVRVYLNARPSEQLQELEMPLDVYGFDVDNVSAMHDFSFVLPNGSSNLNMMMYTSSTEPYFQIEIKKSGGLGTGGVQIYLEYHADGKMEQWIYEVQPLKDADDNFNVDVLDNSIPTTYISTDESWTWEDETPPYNQTYLFSSDTIPVLVPFQVLQIHSSPAIWQ